LIFIHRALTASLITAGISLIILAMERYEPYYDLERRRRAAAESYKEKKAYERALTRERRLERLEGRRGLTSHVKQMLRGGIRRVK
jgi:hypothetical protein